VRPKGKLRAPVILNIRCALRWRTYPESDSFETVLLIEPPRRSVFLMGVEFKTLGVE
jgi:hypothetical protein